MCTLKILHILRRSEYVAPYRYMYTYVKHSDQRVVLGCPTKEEEGRASYNNMFILSHVQMVEVLPTQL